MQPVQPSKYPWGKLPDSELARVAGFQKFEDRGKGNDDWPCTDVPLQRGSRIADQREVIAALDNQFSGFGGDYILRDHPSNNWGEYLVARSKQRNWEFVDVGEASPAAERLRRDDWLLRSLNEQAGPEDTWRSAKSNAQGEWNQKTIKLLEFSKEKYERHDRHYLRDALKSTFRCFANMDNAKAAQEFAYGSSQLLFHWFQRGHTGGDESEKLLPLFNVPSDLAKLTGDNSLAVKKAFFEAVPENVQTSIGQIIPSNLVTEYAEPLAALGTNILAELPPDDPDREKIAAKTRNAQDIVEGKWTSSQPFSFEAQRVIAEEEARARLQEVQETMKGSASASQSKKESAVQQQPEAVNPEYLARDASPLPAPAGVTKNNPLVHPFGDNRGDDTINAGVKEIQAPQLHLSQIAQALPIRTRTPRKYFGWLPGKLGSAYPPAFSLPAAVQQIQHDEPQSSVPPGFAEFVADHGVPKNIRVKAQPAHDLQGPGRAFTLTDSNKTKLDVHADGPLGDVLLQCSASRSQFWNFTEIAPKNWQADPAVAGRKTAAPSKDTQMIMNQASSTAYKDKSLGTQSRK